MKLVTITQRVLRQRLLARWLLQSRSKKKKMVSTVRELYDTTSYETMILPRRQQPVNVPIVLVGNKTDLHMERMISSDEGRRLAESWKAAFIEASAKQNEVCSPFRSSVSCDVPAI
ncbi:hypothetical protein J6590_038929 [Homalodisca vitripennis]|nr:hypothetical protein J6590_038929 [Homalodisca vitripennis]